MTETRVTNADIYKKIDELTDNIHEYRISTEKRIVYLETCLEITKDDVDNLKKRDYIVGGFGGMLAVIAGFIGINK